MGTSKEEFLSKILILLPKIKTENPDDNLIKKFLILIEKPMVNLMRYFGMHEEEIDEEFSYFSFCLIKSVNKLKDDSKFYSYLYGFVRNKAKFYIKSKISRKMVSIEQIDEPIYKDFEFEVDNIKELISESLLKLNSVYSETLYLHYFENMPISSIAKQLQCSESCIKPKLLRGKNQLKKIINNRIST